MLSIPHMIVVFLVVLVVFGPQKLPELARSLGKLMAEFRKASGDFRNAFEEEMRDLERQARIAEIKRQAAEAARDAVKDPPPPASLGSPAGSQASSEPSDGHRLTEAVPLVTPSADSVPRLDAASNEPAPSAPSASKNDSSTPESTPSHDQQQPA